MTTYYDTGVLLKLYTAELESPAVEAFVRGRREAIGLTGLHRAECVAALRLKQFRRECTMLEATRALDLQSEDLRNGVLQLVAMGWDAAWDRCFSLAGLHASKTGCRTLDTLHVASALVLQASAFVTTDKRQTDLAQRAGLKVLDPTAS